ncbi:MAG: BrnT family toxin [Anaerolineae bacterium]
MNASFEWDEAKREANIHKHGIDFLDVPEVFKGDTVIVEDDRFDYGETRFVALGLLRGRAVAIVFVEYEDTIRIISARKATRHEERAYFERISH